MGEIVNLRRVRKQRARDGAAMDAAAARARYGRTKAESEASARVKQSLDSALDDALLEDSTRDGEPLE